MKRPRRLMAGPLGVLGLLPLWVACGGDPPLQEKADSPSATHSASPPTNPAYLPNDSLEWRWVRAQGGDFWCAWRPVNGPLEMGPSFPIEVRVAKTRDGEPIDVPASQIEVDARMPDHGHGMLQYVEIERVGPGHFRVNGMRLHMVGYWDLTVDVSRGAWTERAQFPIEL